MRDEGNKTGVQKKGEVAMATEATFIERLCHGGRTERRAFSASKKKEKKTIRQISVERECRLWRRKKGQIIEGNCEGHGRGGNVDYALVNGERIAVASPSKRGGEHVRPRRLIRKREKESSAAALWGKKKEVFNCGVDTYHKGP